MDEYFRAKKKKEKRNALKMFLGEMDRLRILTANID